MKSTGPALADQLGDRYRVHNAGVNGSGLLTPDVFDWPAQLPASLNQIDPDLVVMLFIGNYTSDPAQMWVAADGQTVPDMSAPAFAEEWGQQAERYVTRATSSGAEVVLVLPPPMIAARVQRVTDRLRAEYQAIAARHPDLTLVDAATAVGGPDGEWIATRQTAAGTLAPVRVADTVHLADHGQALVAHEIHLGIRRAVQARSRNTTTWPPWVARERTGHPVTQLTVRALSHSRRSVVGDTTFSQRRVQAGHHGRAGLSAAVERRVSRSVGTGHHCVAVSARSQPASDAPASYALWRNSSSVDLGVGSAPDVVVAEDGERTVALRGPCGLRRAGGLARRGPTGSGAV